MRFIFQIIEIAFSNLYDGLHIGLHALFAKMYNVSDFLITNNRIFVFDILVYIPY